MDEEKKAEEKCSSSASLTASAVADGQKSYGSTRKIKMDIRAWKEKKRGMEWIFKVITTKNLHTQSGDEYPAELKTTLKASYTASTRCSHDSKERGREGKIAK